MLTQERLKELLHYDPDTGLFTNLIQRSSRAKKGIVAGYEDTEGYIKIEIYGKPYLAHRLVWFYMYGSFPEIFLDHKNEIKNDNRIANLRLATNQENRHNISNQRTNNTSGFIGVAWNKENKKWRSQIQTNKQ